MESTPTDAGSTQRSIEFRDEIAGMQIRTPVDANERKWLIAGFVAVAVGLAFIVAGYWGASGESLVEKQIPYVLSGGVVGLALVVVGSALVVRYSLSRYLRFWLVRSIHEQRVQTDRQIEALDRLSDTLRRDPAQF